MKEPISILSIASISSLGNSQEEIWKNYQTNDHFITEKQFVSSKALVSELSAEGKEEILKLRDSDLKYKKLDDSVLYAIYVSRNAVKEANWVGEHGFGVNIGSSRGATSLFEKYHQEFLESKITSTLTSPTTTLGNISSWVAHDLQTNGPEISHSITCSTALHALLNGIAWIQSGMTDKFLIGGAEASLTEFTIAQMRALKIYGRENNDYPCRALDVQKKKNTMILGEGASAICIEKGNKENALAKVIGIGYATEILEHNISISTEAECFQKSMKMAIGEINPKEIDAIVMHAPGTIQGDLSELKAIKKLFGENVPFLTTNKWKLGHTFATSGMLNLELAILMLQKQQAISVPFGVTQSQPKRLQNILINAVGFGGNAVSVIINR